MIIAHSSVKKLILGGFLGAALLLFVLFLFSISMFMNNGLIANACTASGSDNKSKIYNGLISEVGLTAEQAAGGLGNIQSESGGTFSPFIHEYSQSWESGGWGIVQWTGGRRARVVDYVKSVVGEDLFNKYYKNYGNNAIDFNKNVATIPSDVSDQFLKAQIQYIKIELAGSYPIIDYALRHATSVDTSSDIWLVNYEAPADIEGNRLVRRNYANTLYDKLAKTSVNCFSVDLVSGGMNMVQGEAFMRAYMNGEDSKKYTGKAAACRGGILMNCVSFSVYFLNKYTTAQGFMDLAPGYGGAVADNVKSRNPEFQTGQIPKSYALFSRGAKFWGHTGIILGVNTEKGTVIIGEANCNHFDFGVNKIMGIDVREASIASMTGNGYRYVYLDNHLKGELK